MKKLIAVLLLLSVLFSAFAVPVSAADDFSKTLALFPSEYQNALKALHNAHPNWTFQKLTVGIDFKTAVNAEHNCKQRLCTVQTTNANDPRVCPSTCANKAYHLTGDSRCASWDYIAECMDPTNYITESQIFQFEKLGYKSYYTSAKLETVLDNKQSFMHKKTCTVSGKSYYYSSIINAACKANNVDALFIISRITKEVGAAYPASLAKGYKYTVNKKTYTVYNFFNIGGGVSASAAYAYNHGWTNPKAALEGGIKFIAQNYVSAGQNTNYLQKFQVNPNANYYLYEHQYMQTVDAITDEASFTYNSYNTIGTLGSAHTFLIPVYNNLSAVDYEAQDLIFKKVAFSSAYAYVNSQITSSLSLRNAPSTGSIIASLSRSTLLKITSKSANWFKVSVLSGSHKGKTGYVFGDYVNFCQTLAVAGGGTYRLEPKLTKSTCTYEKTLEIDNNTSHISASGLVTGIKKGTTIFKAASSKGAVGFLAVVCTSTPSKPVVIRPEAPKFSFVRYTSAIKITWNKIPEAKSYRVYSYNQNTKKYTVIGNTTALYYNIKSLKPYTTYSYLVRALDENTASSFTQKSVKSVKTLVAKPVFTLSAAGNNSTAANVSVKWSKVTGAVSYAVYHAAAGKYTRVATVKGLGATIKNVPANSVYTVLVRALDSQGAGNTFSSADNKSVKTPAKPALPVILAPETNAKHQITVKWKSVSCKAYQVQFSRYKNFSSVIALKTVPGQKTTSYTGNNFTKGVTYYVRVRSFSEANGANIFSNWSKAKSIVCK